MYIFNISMRIMLKYVWMILKDSIWFHFDIYKANSIGSLLEEVYIEMVW